MKRFLAPLKYLMTLCRSWFSLTHRESASLLLVLAIVLIGLIAKSVLY